MKAIVTVIGPCVVIIGDAVVVVGGDAVVDEIVLSPLRVHKALVHGVTRTAPTPANLQNFIEEADHKPSSCNRPA
jgi:hypothetical protein